MHFQMNEKEREHYDIIMDKFNDREMAEFFVRYDHLSNWIVSEFLPNTKNKHEHEKIQRFLKFAPKLHKLLWLDPEFIH